MNNTDKQSEDVSKMPSYKRIELVFARFAEEVGGTYSVKAGLDDRDAEGLHSDFTKWFIDRFIDANKPTNYPSVIDLFEYAYVKKEFRAWSIEFRSMLSKVQSFDTADVSVFCLIQMKKGIKIELARNTNNSILPGKNKPFDVHRWLGFFFPRRILKSRGTRLGQPYILSFEDSILQNSFVGTCNDQGVGEQLVQDQRIQECLRKHRDFKYLEIGHADWSGTNNFHMLEVKTSTNVSLGTQPLEEALELVKTCLTLLEEFGVIAENVSDCS